jgi:hypothetical protein
MSSTAPRPLDAPLPERIGPYLVRGALGSGGMGVVYRAEHTSTGRPVALKTVQAQGEAVLAGIRREIHALRTLDHPGVVGIVDDGLEAGVPWYAMEVLEGPTLRRFHRERSAARGLTPQESATRLEGASSSIASSVTTARGLSPRGGHPESSPSGAPTPRPSSFVGGLREVRDALTTVRAVCRTLAFVHGRGIVHRDLKPDNVILVPDRGPVIVDFGIAARGLGARGREILHATGRAVGSPGYMAPEQILGEIVDARADLYAIGCMLFEAITGRLPFDSDSAQLVLSRKLYEEAPSPRSLVAAIPDALDRLVVRLLARRPQDRPGHADDVAAALAALGAEEPAGAVPAAEPYLYRPGLAGRGETIEAIERLLAGASIAPVEVSVPSSTAAMAIVAATPIHAATMERPLAAGQRTLAFETRGGDPTLDVTSGRDLAAPRRGGFVLVGGESGVGKTRLALEVTTRAAQRGFRVVTGQCERVGADDDGARGGALRAAPLHPLRELFHAIADRCRAMGPTGYGTLLGERGPILAAFEPSLEDLEGAPRGARPAEVPPEAARTRLHEALGETLRAFATSEPLLLVLDDLQWSDEHTLGFLAWLGEAWFDGTPVVVLATYRLEEVGTELRALLDKKGVLSEQLARLDERAVARIVRDMLAVEQPDERLVGYLHRHTEGNPFFVSEYLRTAIDRRLLSRDAAGRWRFEGATVDDAELERLPLPATLRELVALRLDGLSAVALEMARVMAVLGREVEAELLADALGASDGLSPDAILELLRRQVIEEPVPGVVRFVHDKLRESLYASLPEPKRVALHARAARALGALAGARGEIDRVASELAHHHAASGAIGEALGFLDQAAERAMASGAASDALRLLELAARAFDERADRAERQTYSDRRVRWERRSAEAHHALGDLRAAEQRGRSALRLATGRETLLDEKLEVERAARARFAAGTVLAVSRQLWELVLGSGGRADLRKEPAPGWERWREASLAAEKLAESYLFLNDLNRAAASSVLATNYAHHLGPSPELARGCAKLANACAYVPSERLAEVYVARADRVANLVDDAETHVVVNLMCGYWTMGAGRLEEASRRLSAALDRARALSDRRRKRSRSRCSGCRPRSRPASTRRWFATPSWSPRRAGPATSRVGCGRAQGEPWCGAAWGGSTSASRRSTTSPT